MVPDIEPTGDPMIDEAHRLIEQSRVSWAESGRQMRRLSLCFVLAILIFGLMLLWPPDSAGAQKRPGPRPTATVVTTWYEVADVEALAEGWYRATIDGQSALVRVTSLRAPLLRVGRWEATAFRAHFQIVGRDI